MISSGIFELLILLLSQFMLLVSILVDSGIFLSEAQEDVVEFPIDLGMPCFEPVPKAFDLFVAWFVFHDNGKVVLL